MAATIEFVFNSKGGGGGSGSGGGGTPGKPSGGASGGGGGQSGGGASAAGGGNNNAYQNQKSLVNSIRGLLGGGSQAIYRAADMLNRNAVAQTANAAGGAAAGATPATTPAGASASGAAAPKGGSGAAGAALAVGVVVEAGEKLAKAIKGVAELVKSKVDAAGDAVAPYSGAVAAQRAQNDVREVLMNLDRAEKFGSGLADYEGSKADFARAMTRLTDVVLQFLPLVTGTVQILTTIAEAVDFGIKQLVGSGTVITNSVEAAIMAAANAAGLTWAIEWLKKRNETEETNKSAEFLESVWTGLAPPDNEPAIRRNGVPLSIPESR